MEQCLNDYGIPLYLSHTVTAVHGDNRLTGVTVSRVDEHLRPVPGTEKEYKCDTLILSVGLIPENELSLDAGVTLDDRTKGAVVDENYQTSVDGIFAAGNVLHVHDLVDFVSEEAKTAGRNAAEYVKNLQADTDDRDKHSREEAAEIVLNPVEGVRYTVPSTINPVHMDENLTVRFRVGGVYKNCYVSVYFDEERVIHKKRPVVAPGEMEQIKLTKEQLMKYPGLKTITVKIEEA